MPDVLDLQTNNKNGAYSVVRLDTQTKIALLATLLLGFLPDIKSPDQAIETAVEIDQLARAKVQEFKNMMLPLQQRRPRS